MKILHIDTGREMRGGQYQVCLLMKGLREKGHDCLLLARPESLLAQRATQEGFPVFPADMRELWERSRSVDVIHAHDGRAHTLSAVAAQKRFVVSRRVSFPPQRTFLSRLKYGRAARYIAVSQFVAGELRQAGIPAEKIDVVFDSVDVRDLGCEPGQPAGREPFAVAPAFRHDPRKLSALTEEACRLAGVKLVFSRDLPADLRNAAAFVYLTATEGLGSAALLAMAAGVPVVASCIQGLAEVFEHGVSGLYVDNDAQQVAAGLRRVLHESALAQHLTAAAKARVAELFSVERMVGATLHSYQRALRG